MVSKYGSSTGETRGKIITLDTVLKYPANKDIKEELLLLTNQIGTELMSEGGDSGALGIVQINNEKKAFGMENGSNQTRKITFYSPIDHVLDSLNVELLV